MPETNSPPARSSRRVAFASLIGTTIEWYDFFLFGTAAALVFNELFFPSFDPLTGTLAAFGTFAVGFIARPFGGAVFAHFGDRVGRKPMLVYSLLLMGVGDRADGPAARLRHDRRLGADPARACCASPRASASAASGAARR